MKIINVYIVITALTGVGYSGLFFFNSFVSEREKSEFEKQKWELKKEK